MSTESEIDKHWQDKYEWLKSWYFRTMKISFLLESIPNKDDKIFKLFRGAFFEGRCGTYSSGCYEQLKEYIFANADKEKLERLKIDW